MEKEEISKFKDLERRCFEDLSKNEEDGKDIKPVMQTSRRYCGCCTAKTEKDGKTLRYIATCPNCVGDIELQIIGEERVWVYKCKYVRKRKAIKKT